MESFKSGVEYGPKTKEETVLEESLLELNKLLKDGDITKEELIHKIATYIPDIRTYLIDHIVDEQPEALNER